MGRRSARHHAHQVPGHNRIRIRSTSASPGLAAKRVDAAGAHIANSATNPELTEAALRLLLLPTVPCRLELLVLGMLEHFLCRTINALLIHSNLAFLGGGQMGSGQIGRWADGQVAKHSLFRKGI
jgi:hypothetical protein